MAKKKDTLAENIKGLRDSFERWKFLYQNGGSDPFYADGTNLNLVHNHIEYHKNQILQEYGGDIFLLPDEFSIPTPELVPYSYMANPEKIKKEAEEALRIYNSTDVFDKVAERIDTMDKYQKSTAISIAHYPKTLQQAIDSNDLITMRRYTPKRAIDDIERAEKFLESLPVEIDF